MTLSIWVPEFLTAGEAEVSEDPDAADLTALEQQLNRFTEMSPQTEVRVIPKKAEGSGGLFDLFSTASEAAPSILPDVIMLNTGDLSAAAAAELIQPVDRWLPGRTDYYPFALNAVSQDLIPDESGEPERWGLPYVAYADHMVYRRGISSAPPLSWTRVLTSGYSMLFPLATANDLAGDALVAAYLGSGGRVVDENGRPTLDRAVLEDLYGFFDALRTQELINVERALSLSDASACWDVYQQGIGRLSPVPMGVYWTTRPADSLAGWMPTADGSPVTLIHPWHWAVVTTDPERQEAAIELVQWLTDPENMGAVAGSIQGVPVRQGALETWIGESEELTTLETILSSGIAPLPPAVDISVRRALQAGLDALYRTEVESPEEAVDYALTRLRP
jgi:ABC-type glycerol-3-phosphate transport system substrate-binding protein